MSIRLAKRALLGYFRSELGAGQLLEGITSVRGGPVEDGAIPAAKHPALSIWVPSYEYTAAQGGRRIDMDAQIWLELYTQSAKSLDEAEDECMALVLSDDRSQGVWRALERKRRLPLENGETVLVTAGRCEQKFGRGASDGFTFAVRIPLKVMSMQGMPG